MAGHTHFDESLEEYLEAIYRLEREGSGVTTSGLAADLGVAPASVSGMLKKLAEGGYLEYRARGEAKLTERGGSRDIRDHAMLLLGFARGWRRSELDLSRPGKPPNDPLE